MAKNDTLNFNFFPLATHAQLLKMGFTKSIPKELFDWSKINQNQPLLIFYLHSLTIHIEMDLDNAKTETEKLAVLAYAKKTQEFCQQVFKFM